MLKKLNTKLIGKIANISYTYALPFSVCIFFIFFIIGLFTSNGIFALAGLLSLICGFLFLMYIGDIFSTEYIKRKDK